MHFSGLRLCKSKRILRHNNESSMENLGPDGKLREKMSRTEAVNEYPKHFVRRNEFCNGLDAQEQKATFGAPIRRRRQRLIAVLAPEERSHTQTIHLHTSFGLCYLTCDFLESRVYIGRTFLFISLAANMNMFIELCKQGDTSNKLVGQNKPHLGMQLVQSVGTEP